MERCRLYKIGLADRHWRYCLIGISRGLFGEWIVEQETGRYGEAGSYCRDSLDDEHHALEHYGLIKDHCLSQGYLESESIFELGYGYSDSKRISNILESQSMFSQHGSKNTQAKNDGEPTLDSIYNSFLAFFRREGVSSSDIKRFCFNYLNIDGVQTRFPLKRFANRNINGDNVVKFAPRIVHGFLDRELYDYFSRTPRFFPLIARLESAGIRQLGHLVQLTPDEFMEIACHETETAAHLRDHLNRCGLDFGSRVPSWIEAKQGHKLTR